MELQQVKANRAARHSTRQGHGPRSSVAWYQGADVRAEMKAKRQAELDAIKEAIERKKDAEDMRKRYARKIGKAKPRVSRGRLGPQRKPSHPWQKVCRRFFKEIALAALDATDRELRSMAAAQAREMAEDRKRATRAALASHFGTSARRGKESAEEQEGTCGKCGACRMADRCLVTGNMPRW